MKMTFALMVLLAAPAFAQEAPLPDGPGKDEVQTSCTACHAASQFTSQRMAKAQWADIVDQMIARGAAVSDADYPKVVDYLAKNFGPANAATPAKPPSAPNVADKATR